MKKKAESLYEKRAMATCVFVGVHVLSILDAVTNRKTHDTTATAGGAVGWSATW